MLPFEFTKVRPYFRLLTTCNEAIEERLQGSFHFLPLSMFLSLSESDVRLVDWRTSRSKTNLDTESQGGREAGGASERSLTTLHLKSPVMSVQETGDRRQVEETLVLDNLFEARISERDGSVDMVRLGETSAGYHSRSSDKSNAFVLAILDTPLAKWDSSVYRSGDKENTAKMKWRDLTPNDYERYQRPAKLRFLVDPPLEKAANATTRLSSKEIDQAIVACANFMLYIDAHNGPIQLRRLVWHIWMLVRHAEEPENWEDAAPSITQLEPETISDGIVSDPSNTKEQM
ncbi:hypothetical protein F4778DRAFT_423708 [Xylariomycetidae sp. FL2044]|nr:hypothetical protein F4778DRAFT_423708 [Xylariomycetidae sp. FL2044]